MLEQLGDGCSQAGPRFSRAAADSAAPAPTAAQTFRTSPNHVAATDQADGQRPGDEEPSAATGNKDRRLVQQRSGVEDGEDLVDEAGPADVGLQPIVPGDRALIRCATARPPGSTRRWMTATA